MGRGVTLLREHDVRIFRDAGKQSLVGRSYELDIELFSNRGTRKDYPIPSFPLENKLEVNNAFSCKTFINVAKESLIHILHGHIHMVSQTKTDAWEWQLGIGARDTGHPRPIKIQITLSVSWNKF